MNDELAPEIAELLAQAEKSLPTATDTKLQNDSFSDQECLDLNSGVDLNLKCFAPVTQFFMPTPSNVFDDTNYYKTALSGENESSQKLHNILTKYLTAKDPKDRTVFRQQLITIYWEFIKSVAPKISLPAFANSKRMLLRFGAILPSLLTEEQRQTFSSIFMENNSGEPIYYIDEWFKDIAQGKVSPSATDESRPAKKLGATNSSEDANRLLQLQSKNNGKLQNAESLLAAKESERKMLEAELKSRVEQLCEHQPLTGMETHFSPYNDTQKRLLTEINDRLKSLQRNDKELCNFITEYQEARSISDSLKQKIETSSVTSEINTSDLTTEIGTVRQMAKMTVGRQGNHFPILTREYFHCIPREIGTRENILSILAWIESIDPGAFCRIHKNTSHRIVPYVVLVPTYGDLGFCWEPFDRYNRTTSRGRIVVPMYPKNLQTAILTAVADLRWQVAKEKASYYWMEEGLTGQYYQWFSSQKLKGDLKDYFINDYVLWMTKESDGVQRLEKEVRGVFWRHIPFTQEIKDKLKTRSLIYQELYQRDINRSMSDGY